MPPRARARGRVLRRARARLMRGSRRTPAESVPIFFVPTIPTRFDLGAVFLACGVVFLRKRVYTRREMQDVHFSSAKIDWTTPKPLFSKLEDIYGVFTLDAAASADNALCSKFFSEQDSALDQSWEGHNAFVNPPYGPRLTSLWIRKCILEAARSETRVTALVPARTDTIAFHEAIETAEEIILLRGRVRFGGAKHGAPFPSAVIHWGSSPPLSVGPQWFRMEAQRPRDGSAWSMI